MTRLTESCVRELNNFLHNVIYGKDGFFDNYEGMQCYSFGGTRTLFDVFTRALATDETRSECEAVVKSLTSFVDGDIKRLRRKCVEKRLPNDERMELSDRLKLAWEVFQTTRKFFPDSEEDSTLYNIFDDTHCLILDGFLTESDVPRAAVEFFGKKVDTLASQKSQGPPSFLRDESFFQSVPEKEPPHAAFIKSYDEAIESLKESPARFDAWFELKNQKLAEGAILPSIEVSRVMEKIMSVWEVLMSEKDSKVLHSLLDVLKGLILVTSGPGRSCMFEKIIEYYQGSNKGLPSFEQYILSYQSRLTRAVNSLGDHNAIQSDPDQFALIQSEVHFLVLLAPFATLHCLIQHCLENKQVVPAVLKILRDCQPLFEVEIEAGNDTRLPVLVFIIDELFVKNIARIGVSEYVDSFVYLVGALSRQKRTVVREKGEDGRILTEEFGDVVEECMLYPVDIFHLFLFPRLFREKISSEEIKLMLLLMRKIFLATGSKESPLNWVNFSDEIVEGHRAIPSVELFVVVHGFLMQFEQLGQDVADLCLQVLKAMASKLKEDDVVFSSAATEFLLHKMTLDAWWFRYGIVEWFSDSLGSPKRQVPGGLYHALPESSRERMEEIRVDFEVAPVGCMLHSLFELALFDTDFAIDLLNHGLDLMPLDDLLLDQIALALCDVCSKPFFYSRIPSMLPLFERIIELFDPRSPIPTVLDKVNENIFVAIRQLKSINLVGRAAKIASSKVYHSNTEYAAFYPSMSLDRPANPGRVADQLLQAFCELAKNHIDKQIQFYRSFIRKNKQTEDQGNRMETSRMEERLLTQVVILFNETVMFTRIHTAEQMPKSLQILINVLSDYVKEVQNAHSPASLNNKKIEYNKSETVYVYAQGSAGSGKGSPNDLPPIGNYTGHAASSRTSTTSQDSFYVPTYTDPQYNHPMKRQSSGFTDNDSQDDYSTAGLGDPAGGYGSGDGQSLPHSKRYTTNQPHDAFSSMRAVAHQIDHPSTRNQVERRLSEEQPVRKPFNNQNSSNSRQWEGNRSNGNGQRNNGRRAGQYN